MVTKKLKAQKHPKKVKKGKKKVSPWLVGGLLLLLAGAILFPYIRAGKLATEGAVVPAETRRFCLDISHHNSGIVWDSLKVVVSRSGRTSKDILHAQHIYPVHTVVVKATEGEKMKDRIFPEYWEEAGSRDFVRGAYHFFRSSKDPVRQAHNYMETVSLRHSDLPPILDVETLHEGCTKEELNRKVLLWLETVEKHYGRKPMVYTSDSFARDILSPKITGRYPMWIARYNELPPQFENWTMWQFTEKAVLYGVSGYVDLSVIR